MRQRKTSSAAVGASDPSRTRLATSEAARPSRAALAVGIGALVTVVAVSSFALREPNRPSIEARGDSQDPARTTASTPRRMAATSATNDDAMPGMPAVSRSAGWQGDFKATRARFDELRWFGDDIASLTAMAQQADETLPSLLARGNIEPGDALLLKADVLEVLEPDETRRIERLTTWWCEHPLPRPPHLATGFRYEEALKLEQSLLLEWQSQPSVDRDVGDLAAQLRDFWERHR